MILPLREVDVVIDSRAMGTWCQLSYQNHPKGCPNYAKRKTCPPFSKPLNDLVESPFYLVIQNFDIEAQAKRMKERHPNWTEKQSRNCLYWQRGLMKKLRKEAEEFVDRQDNDLMLLEIPEANGVDLFNTCKNLGIILERRPRKTIRKMMVIGKRLHKYGS